MLTASRWDFSALSTLLCDARRWEKRFVDLGLGGKVVVITGGAKGIGAAIARTCAQEGAVPVILDRDKEAGEQLSGELRGSGGARGAEFLEIDLCSAASCRSPGEYHPAGLLSGYSVGLGGRFQSSSTGALRTCLR